MAETLTPVTDWPNVMALDVSDAPLPGATVISLDWVAPLATGLVPLAVILSTPPFATALASVKVAMWLLELSTTFVTVSLLAVPADGRVRDRVARCAAVEVNCLECRS